MQKSLSPLFALCYAKRVSKETAKSLEEDTALSVHVWERTSSKKVTMQ